jgi:hypothetical protein
MDKGYLCYLWFGNGINIDELGLNFDTNYYFTIEKETKNSSNVIKITEHYYVNSVPSNFFGNTISALTTIVGENGAGKSSILRFILNNLLIETAMHGEYYIALFKVGEEYKIAHNFFWDILFIDKNKNEKSFDNKKFKVMEFYNCALSISNVFDGYKEQQRNDDDLRVSECFTVISTLNCLINEAFQLEDNNRVKDHYKNSKVINFIYERVIDDTLEYLSNGDFKKLFTGEFIGFPNGINLDITVDKFNDNINYLYDDFRQQCVRSYLLPKENFSKKYNKYKDIQAQEGDAIIIEEKTASFDSACNLLAINYCNYLKNNCDEFTKEYVEFFFSELLKGKKNGIQVLVEVIKNKPFKISDDDKWLIEMLSDFCENEQFYQYDLKKIVVHFDKYLKDVEQLEVLRKIRKLIKEKDREKIFTISFTHIIKGDKKSMYSTGELLRLRFLIELYKFSQLVKKRSKTNNKNILILIDEWDQYMHPNYQRRGITELIKFIEELFEGYSVQIIMTSNAPYMLSDMPNNCVVPMKGGVVTEVLGATFGTNIHTLLKNQFFMETTIGEFAKQKINDIYNKLKKLNSLNYKGKSVIDNEEKSNIKAIISIIGEPLVRTRLLEMYYLAFPQEQKNQFFHYENQIRELKEALQSNIAIDKDKVFNLKKCLQDSINELDKYYRDREIDK